MSEKGRGEVKRYRLFRTGYHPKNNPESAGGPETIMVGEIEANSPRDAVDQTLMACARARSQSSCLRSAFSYNAVTRARVA